MVMRLKHFSSHLGQHSKQDRFGEESEKYEISLVTSITKLRPDFSECS
jgi:hypothetical protein